MFSGYHVDLHNQYEFREEMEHLICNSGADSSFTTYPRNVWENNGGKRIKTRGLVMEVDSQRTNETVECVLQMRFTGNFRGVTFNPFIRIQGIGQLVMNKVFNAQQDYLNNTTSTLVPGINPTTNDVVMKNGETTTLREVMINRVVDRQRMVISAVNKDDELYLLHHKQHQ